MSWLIPGLLFAAAFFFWVISFRTDDAIAAWCRFLLAGFLMLLAVIYAVAMAAQWVMS